MDVMETALPGVIRIVPKVFEDDRGFFMETWRARDLAAAGIDVNFVQENVSRSVHRWTLRGIHYQLPQPQGKLVRVVEGEVYDVAVDLRRSSPNFKRWVGVYLSAGNKNLLWIPPGFGHGFLVTSELAEFEYKCTTYYESTADRAIRWNDPDIDVVWPLPANVQPVMSGKDAAALYLADAEIYE